MSQPQPEFSYDQLSVEGLGHVFVDVVDVEIPEGIPVANQGIPAEIPEGIPAQNQDIPEGIPVEEAAKLLGTSSRAVIKRLQKGTLKGHKAASKYGDKWLVDLEGIPAANQGIPVEIPEGIPAQNQGVPVEIVQELLRKVEALTYRNGYLEAQLSEKEVHIKLLTDSQHKKTWWSKVRCWFTVQEPQK